MAGAARDVTFVTWRRSFPNLRSFCSVCSGKGASSGGLITTWTKAVTWILRGGGGERKLIPGNLMSNKQFCGPNNNYNNKNNL